MLSIKVVVADIEAHSLVACSLDIPIPAVLADDEPVFPALNPDSRKTCLWLFCPVSAGC